MADVTIKTRENGPFLVTGLVEITDHLGNKYDLTGKANVALCRCGHSKNKPFCDGSHRGCGFVAGETVPGTKIAAGTPAAYAVRATARPWLPPDAVTIPAAT